MIDSNRQDQPRGRGLTDEDMAKVEALLERAAIATEGKSEAEYRRHPAYREAKYLLLGR